MRLLLGLCLLAAIGCGTDPEPAPEPAAPTDAPGPGSDAEPRPAPRPAATEPAARASPRPTPRPSARPARPSPKPVAAFVEPKPRPFRGGRASWRQEPWWELTRTGSFPTVVYRVGELYGVMPAARWGRPEASIPPRPRDAWLARRCKRCSRDANPAGNPPPTGPTDLHETLDEELSEADQDKIEADFRGAAKTWPKQAKLDIAADGWVTLTHSPEAHARVQAWIRKRICPHQAKPKKAPGR